MTNLLKQITPTVTPLLSNSASFTLDYVRVQGPARERLRKRYGVHMRDFLAGMSHPLDVIVQAGMATDTGTRPHNEDSVVTVMAHLDDGRVPVPMVLVAVADGIGGSNDGDLASGLAIENLTETVVDYMVDGVDHMNAFRFDVLSIESLLSEAFSAAHLAIKRETAGGGSTMTCAMILDHTAYIAHVGDSRAYLLGDESKQIELITRDHRFVSEWVDLGIISTQEAVNHPQAHTLYRALGKRDQCEVDITRRHMDDGSRLLLCTDGVWEAVSIADLARLIRRSTHPQWACDSLLTMALGNDTHDDVSAVLVEFPE